MLQRSCRACRSRPLLQLLTSVEPRPFRAHPRCCVRSRESSSRVSKASIKCASVRATRSKTSTLHAVPLSEGVLLERAAVVYGSGAGDDSYAKAWSSALLVGDSRSGLPHARREALAVQAELQTLGIRSADALVMLHGRRRAARHCDMLPRSTQRRWHGVRAAASRSIPSICRRRRRRMRGLEVIQPLLRFERRVFPTRARSARLHGQCRSAPRARARAPRGTLADCHAMASRGAP